MQFIVIAETTDATGSTIRLQTSSIFTDVLMLTETPRGSSGPKNVVALDRRLGEWLCKELPFAYSALFEKPS